MTGVDDMSTQDVFGYFKEYPPAHIEWIDDTSCEYNKYTCARSYVSLYVFRVRVILANTDPLKCAEISPFTEPHDQDWCRA